MKRTALAVLLLSLTACSAGIDLFPLEGPYSKLSPPPVLRARAEGVTSNSGQLSITYPDGEICKGRWSSVAPQFAGASTGVLMGTYGALVGFTAGATGIVPGVNRGEAFVTCRTGRTMQAEFFTGSGTAHGYGIAKDSDQNVFKMLF